MEKTLFKIDSQGKYCKFPGITIVSAFLPKDERLWKQVYDELDQCQLLKEYYSPLPFESYHMTTNDIYTEARDGGSDWKGFITKDMERWQRLFKVLNEKAFNPEITIEDLVVQGVVLFELKLNEEQHSIIKSVAEEFNISHKIPPVFHITLGYKYKAAEETVMNEIKKQLESTLTCLGKKFTLDVPKLCYFNDMTAFIPWDAEEYPFE